MTDQIIYTFNLLSQGEPWTTSGKTGDLWISCRLAALQMIMHSPISVSLREATEAYLAFAGYTIRELRITKIFQQKFCHYSE